MTTHIQPSETLLDLLTQRAKQTPETCAYTFLADGETEEVSLTYRELDAQARTIAAHLHAMARSGERALLLYPSGLDYIAAFFGCLYAGLVVVPCYPPRRNRPDPRLRTIATDAQATILLTTTRLFSEQTTHAARNPFLQEMTWLATDQLTETPAHQWKTKDIDRKTLAFLQYTSGSTSVPKGVMVTHGNLMANEAMGQHAFGHTEHTIFVGWLPLFHDMGLIGNVLQPLYLGIPCFLMSPEAFLQKPVRWLQAISRYKATTSGGPNFAYELCVQKISDEQRTDLDLSSWEVAFNGSEPVRAETLERFTHTFEPCGFRRETFYPCYGMAEATLFISGSEKDAVPVIRAAPRSDNPHHHSRLVGCGHSWGDQQLVIVNPDTLIPCREQQEGEIWVSGSHIARGYWYQPQETALTFDAHLANSSGGPFLRTGDLGFLKDGELFVTGRLKDLIIIRGQNYYPQDLELTVEQCHPALHPGNGAAFSVERAGAERLVIAYEVKRTYLKTLNINEVVNAIRETVFEHDTLWVDAVLLLKTASIPKTSSGKIKRRACREQFLAGTLKIVGEWRQAADLDAQGEHPDYVAPRTPIEEKLAALWAEVLDVEKMSIEDNFFDSGGHSLLATQLMSRLRDAFSIELPLRYLFKSPTVASLAETIKNFRVEHSPAPPVQIIERSDNLPLSFAQERTWFLSQLEGGNAAYNLPAAVRLTGSLSLPALEHSLNEIVQRHETLRTIFTNIHGTPVAQIVDYNYHIPVIDLQDASPEEQRTKIRQFASEQTRIPFKLSQVPLFRFFLIQLAAREHLLLFIIHHIIADGWSLGIFTQELTSLYHAFAKGKPSPLPALPIQYVDFAHWQRQWLSGDVLKTQLAYWQSQLTGVPPMLEIPTDRPHPAVQSFRGHAESFAIPLAIRRKLDALSQQSETTPFMVLLTAFAVLLSRYSEKEDIMIGAPIANRNRTEIEGLIGFFANMLPLRIDLSGNPTFSELLERVRIVTMAAYAHQDVPFEKLVDTLQLERNLSYNLLVQVMFSLRNTPAVKLKVAELSVTPFPLNNEMGILDLFMELQEVEDGFSGTVMYSTDLFDALTITRLIGYFQTLLEHIAANPQQPVAELRLFTETEIAQLTTQFGQHYNGLKNGTNSPPQYPLNSKIRCSDYYRNNDRLQCVHQWFEAQVEKTPDAVAVISDNRSLSYRELNLCSNQLAHQLRDLGVGPDVCVGLYMERALEMVVGLLGILKAGGAFLALTPEYPEAFITRIVAETQTPVLLSQAHLIQRLPQLSEVQTICLSPDWRPQNPAHLDSKVTLDNLAYVTYSSTQPIRITHQAMAQRVAYLQNTLMVPESDVVLQKTPLVQDIAFWEIFGPLMTGGRTVLAPSMSADNLTDLPPLIAAHQVSLLHLTPSELSAFIETCKRDVERPLHSLRQVLCSGEPLRQTVVDAFFQSEQTTHCGLRYFYRVPEAAGEIISQPCQPDAIRETVPLGRPTYRNVCMLDKQLQPVPWGGKGEIYVKDTLAPGGRWLKTGESGHLLNDGTIERSGSRHQYAWIDGFRVDLTAIEVILLSEPSVEECWVLARETRMIQTKLVAYVVVSGRFSPERLQEYVETRLPAYMAPYAYAPLSSLPLTAGGDVDEQALACLEVIDTGVIQQWEKQLQAWPEIKQVAVIAQESVENSLPLHLSDLLADWKTFSANNKIHHAEVSGSTQIKSSKDEDNSKLGRLAISHGKPLRKTTDAPVTLADTLRLAASRQPSHGIIYIQSDNTTSFQTYGALLEQAQRILAGLRKLGLTPQDKVIFQLDSNPDFISAFWGCVLGGFVPVPIGVAPTYEQINNTVSKLGNAWQLLDRPIILTSAKLASSIRSLSTLLNLTHLQVEVIEELKGCDLDQNWHESRATDLALLLLTSGSTGMPKAVMQSHDSLLSRCAGTIQMNDFSIQDVSLNWMPLDHVGGVVMFHLRDVYLGSQQIHAPTENILQEPLKWLDLIDNYKATITWAPNFAFALINDALSKGHRTHQWDLSSMRFILNAGEAIVAKTVRKFMALLVPYKLPATAMHPAWGMSETSSAVTFSKHFSIETTRDDDSFVEVGTCIPGFAMRIVDEQFQVVKEETIARLQVKGLSVTSGYFKNPVLNQEIFTDDGWFETGDLGFIHQGGLTITGRKKDVVIVNGINYYCHEIESVVEEIDQIEVSYTAASAVREGDTDKLAIFFHSKSTDDHHLLELLTQIRTQVVQHIGINPTYLIPVEKTVIPKTAIGKIQRSQLVERFIAGEFDNILKQLDLLSENENTLPDWFYQKIWHRKALHPGTLSPHSGQCLIFLDQLGLGRYLCEKLGLSCIQVEIGSTFVRHNAYHYHILPSEAEHYQRLLSSLKTDGIHVSHILHFWTYEAYEGEINSLEALKQAQVFGMYSLLFLVQALTKTQDSEHLCRLLVISSYAQATLTSDKIAYEKSTLIGLLKTIPLELSWLQCRHIDLEVGPPVKNAEHVLQELRALKGDAEVAYRNDTRLIPFLVKVDLRRQESQAPAIQPGGMYLITGGLGGIGAFLSQFLLEKYHARLIIIGRTVLPARETWSSHFEQNTRMAKRLKNYVALEHVKGGEFIYHAVDVCDVARVQDVVTEAELQWNESLSGIVHLAGALTGEEHLTSHWDVADTHELTRETRATFEATLRPKIEGTWNLYQLITNRPTAVVILFSSVNSLFGGATLSAYVAANSFVDGYSLYQQHQGHCHTYCFNWSIWDDLGLSEGTPAPVSEASRTKGYHLISKEQGLYSFMAGLSRSPAHLIVGLDGNNRHIRRMTQKSTQRQLTAYVTTDTDNLPLAQLQTLEIKDRFGTPCACNVIPLQEMPLTDTGDIDTAQLRMMKNSVAHITEYLAPRTDVERILATIWQDVLNVPKVGIHDNFFTLGGHSLMASQVSSRVGEAFQVDLPMHHLFDKPTIAALAERIEGFRTTAREIQQVPLDDEEREEGIL